MKVKDYMDCFFDDCMENDSLSSLMESIKKENVEYFIVVNEKGLYIGVLKSLDLLIQINQATYVKEVFLKVDAINEDSDIRKIHNIRLGCIPVVNNENFPVGILKLKDTISTLHEVNVVQNTGKKFIRKNLYAKYNIDEIIGNSKTILRLKDTIIKAAKIKSTVLLQGETGVGKELVAQAIANLSDRRFNPFVRVNCAAIPENLLESELFGYEEGAYTGAAKGGSIGKFEVADGGTVFLDEIGDMPLLMQAKILRVLQEKEVERVGSRYPIPVDVRVIAATHADLFRLVEDGKFRRDLYYRLNVIPIKIPSLKEHTEDIEELVHYFAKSYVEEILENQYSIEDGVFQELANYHWPGNVRELKNLVEMAMAMSSGHISIKTIKMFLNSEMDPQENILKKQTDETERDLIKQCLDSFQGNKLKVAEVLGISKSSLYNKLKKYNL
ncbi:MAG: sigma 54-interacting transcriptional regulator [Dethiosulfatibacter sp.]|nr:sigma 54-interacting transcriptional regulator [Dethiosulfatibacter sp.]